MHSVEREKKNPARGPYREKLDRSRARDQPIKFEDLGIRPAQMLEKKIRYDMLCYVRMFCCVMLCYVLCYVMLCYVIVMLCYVMLC